MFCTLSPILSVARDVQFENTGKSELPIKVQSVALKLTSVRPEQLLNAPSPMLVTEFPMVTLVRLEQSEYLQLIVFQMVLIKTVEK